MNKKHSPSPKLTQITNEIDRFCNVRGLRPHWTIQCIRKLSTPVLKAIGPKGKHLTSIAKNARNNNSPVPMVNDLPLVMEMTVGGVGKGAIVLSHDIDWDSCYENLGRVVELERKHNVRSVINILTEWWYSPDNGFLVELQRDGFEIGLHGRYHDAGLAYRGISKIESELARALDQLPEGIKGFRSPALSVSEDLYSTLVKLGFSYDSSLLTLNRYGMGVPLIWPFVFQGLVELPLTLQDDLLFRDMELSETEGLCITIERLKQTVNAGGIFVLNTHPGILESRMGYYSALLEYISENSFEVITGVEAIKRCVEPVPNPVEVGDD